jgi:Subtilase family
VYETNAGQNTFIYHLESVSQVSLISLCKSFRLRTAKGVEGRLDLFQNVEYLQTLESLLALEENDVDSGNGHSTKTAAMAASRFYGASKRATLVAVKLGGSGTIRGAANAVDKVRYDVKAKNRGGKSVVTMSFGAGKLDPTKDLDPQLSPGMRVLREALRKLMAEDVVVVCTAGNNGKVAGRQQIDRVPALFASADDSMPIIVVGAAAKDGSPWPGSQVGPKLSVWAPGVNIQTPEKQGGSTFVSGTSVGTVRSPLPLLAFYLYAQQRRHW